MSDPIRYDATPTPAQLAAGARQVAGYLGAGLAAIGLFPGVVEFLQRTASPEAAGALGAVATVIVFIWGQIATRKQAKKLAVTGEAAPNSVAVPK